MKCNRCAFAPAPDPEGYTDECPAFEQYGTTWKDGSEGCTLTYSHLKKTEEQYAQHLGEMGTDMGLEMTLEHHGLSINRAIRLAEHAIGLYPEGCRKPYFRHGKRFYRPYRNYFSVGKTPDQYWEILTRSGLADVSNGTGYRIYGLTRSGLDWLGRQIHVQIHDEEQ